MLSGLTVALALAAQAAVQEGPPAPPQRSSANRGSDACPAPNPNNPTIVICGERPNNYRIDPDVMAAKRKGRDPGRPVRPGGGAPIPDCAHVGPMPCARAGINLLSAAATAAEMARRLSTGEEIGSMFKTDPEPDEYQRYQIAKAKREAEEAEQSARKAKAAAEADDAAKAAAPQTHQ